MKECEMLYSNGCCDECQQYENTCAVHGCNNKTRNRYCDRCQEEIDGEYVTLWQVIKELWRTR